MMFNNKENLKQYLLGNLDEKETEKIDLKIISDETFEEKLLIAEHSLIEDFIEKNLSPEDLKLFHANFLISPEREKMVEQILALKKFARSEISRETLVERDEDSDEGFFPNLFRTISLQPVKAVFAVLIIGVFFGAMWMVFFSSNLGFSSDPLETEFAKLNEGDFSQVEKYKELRNVSLFPVITRSSEKATTLEQESLTERVLFRLALPRQTDAEELFSVQFLSGETIIFKQKQIRPIINPKGEELRFLIPSSVLKKGEYLLKVEGEKTTEIIYSFSVE